MEKDPTVSLCLAEKSTATDRDVCSQRRRELAFTIVTGSVKGIDLPISYAKQKQKQKNKTKKQLLPFLVIYSDSQTLEGHFLFLEEIKLAEKNQIIKDEEKKNFSHNQA